MDGATNFWAFEGFCAADWVDFLCCCWCCWFFLLIYFLIGIKSLNNVVLVSALQHKSAIITHIPPPFRAALPSPHPTPLGHRKPPGWAPCHAATSHQLSSLHMAVYICWRYFLHPSHSLLPATCPQVHSLYLLRLHSFPANMFINTIFLDSRYICVTIWYSFLSFWLTSLYVWQALGSVLRVFVLLA